MARCCRKYGTTPLPVNETRRLCFASPFLDCGKSSRMTPGSPPWCGSSRVTSVRRNVRIACDQRLQHLTARAAEDVTGDRRELDIGAFQNLVQPVGSRCALLDQAGPIAHQLAELALFTIGHEARLNQA